MARRLPPDVAEVNPIFGNGMVLQREAKWRVWGTVNTIDSPFPLSDVEVCMIRTFSFAPRRAIPAAASSLKVCVSVDGVLVDDPGTRAVKADGAFAVECAPQAWSPGPLVPPLHA